MKVIMKQSNLELMLQQIEDILTANDCQILLKSGVVLVCNERDYDLIDVESGVAVLELPRQIDSERIVLRE